MSDSTPVRSPSSPVTLLVATLAFLVALLALAIILTTTTSTETAHLPPPTPTIPGVMWSTGPYDAVKEAPYEWVSVYPTSSLWNTQGAPSLRFFDHAADRPLGERSFEIGFYRYGPTWYTQNHIVEFWIGGAEAGGTLSVIGNNGTGGQLEVRNPNDTDHISLDYRDNDHPQISVASQPLYLRGRGGVVSVSKHVFEHGFDVPTASAHAGQIIDGAWEDGVIVVPSKAVTPESLVLITPVSAPRGQWWVGELDERTGFTVHSTAPDEAMAFNWLIIN